MCKDLEPDKYLLMFWDDLLGYNADMETHVFHPASQTADTEKRNPLEDLTHGLVVLSLSQNKKKQRTQHNRNHILPLKEIKARKLKEHNKTLIKKLK